MGSLRLVDVSKRFDDVVSVKQINLDVGDGEFVVLVGPSGCGKSTTLRMIAGLEEVSDGAIFIDGKDVTSYLAKDRDIAMVFQNYALYPHMTAFDNIAFNLKLRKFSRADVKQQVHRVADILGIAHLLGRKPQALSGGERQRVAMGRAIVRDPKIFLFDEPLSNLDAKLRVKMRTEIRRLYEHMHTTTVYVTHDQVEAMTLADRMVVMHNGTIEQVGSPAEIYEKPANRFAATFVGSPSMNIVAGTLVSDSGGTSIDIDGFVLKLAKNAISGAAKYVAKPMLIGIRPEHFTLSADGSQAATEDFVPLNIRISQLEYLGSEVLIYFPMGGETICAKLPSSQGIKVGEAITLLIDSTKTCLIDPVTDEVVSHGTTSHS